MPRSYDGARRKVLPQHCRAPEHVPSASWSWGGAGQGGCVTRNLPPQTGERDTVILHINAEGGEFVAIPPAIADGTLCKYSDYLTLDLHYTYFRGEKAKSVFRREQLSDWLNSDKCKTHLRRWVVW